MHKDSASGFWIGRVLLLRAFVDQLAPHPACGGSRFPRRLPENAKPSAILTRRRTMEGIVVEEDSKPAAAAPLSAMAQAGPRCRACDPPSVAAETAALLAAWDRGSAAASSEVEAAFPLLVPPSLPSTSARFLARPVGWGGVRAARGYAPTLPGGGRAAAAANGVNGMGGLPSGRGAIGPEAGPGLTAAAAALSASILAEGSDATDGTAALSEGDAARMAVQFLLTRPAGDGQGVSSGGVLLDGAGAGGEGNGRWREDEAPLYGPGMRRALERAVSRLEGRLRDQQLRGGEEGTDHYATTATGAGDPLNVDHIDEAERDAVGRLTSLLLRPGGEGPREYPTAAFAHSHLIEQFRHIPRRVCQYAFRKNDIVWVCRTCQSDETCVLCHACYSQSDHQGHDVAFYHAQAGGCCDCGDPDAWDPRGFCSRHGPCVMSEGSQGGITGKIVEGAGQIVEAVCDWLVGTVARNVEIAYERCNPPSAAPLSGTRTGESSLIDPGVGNNTEAAVPVKKMARLSTLSSRSAQPKTPQNGTRMANDDQRDPLDANPTDSRVTPENSEPEYGVTPGARPLKTSEMTDNASQEKKFDPEAASSSKSMMGIGRARASNENDYSGFEDDAKPSADLDRSFEFDPEAASTSKSMSNPSTPKRAASSQKPWFEKRLSPAYRIGKAGRDGGGLYLVLHYGDAQSSNDIVVALRDLYSGRRLEDLSAAPLISGHIDTQLSKAARILKSEGDLIVWGPHELVTEVTSAHIALWLDGDYAATERMGRVILGKARVCKSKGLTVSIKTRDELLAEQRAAAAIKWLGTMAKACDPLCNQVSSSIDGERHLVPILSADLKLPATITSAWHSLLLTLLAVPDFKAALANAYCDTYRSVTNEYARGIGVLDRSSYTLSVQFLNRVTYVKDLVRERDLLATLSRSLFETLNVAAVTVVPEGQADASNRAKDDQWVASERPFGFFLPANAESVNSWIRPTEEIMELADGGLRNPSSATSLPLLSRLGERHNDGKITVRKSYDGLATTLDPNHAVLTHRRYSPCVSDLKCVLNVPGMPRLFASLQMPSSSKRSDDVFSFLDGWVKCLGLGQKMDGQVWRTWEEGHVEDEPRGWIGAFNTSISLGSLFERLLGWADNDPSPIQGGASSTRLLSCVELTHHIMRTGIETWQQSEMISYHPTKRQSDNPESACSAALPYATVASKHGAPLAAAAIPVSQIRSWSFHLPLHRFVASCIRDVARRAIDSNGSIDALVDLLHREEEESTRGLFRGLFEFPLLVLSRAAQIRAGLWKRNGPTMLDQMLNYSEPPFCRTLRDADLTLLQFALIGCQETGEDEGNIPRAGGIDCAELITILIHRYGIFNFCGFKAASSYDVERYSDEVRAGLYPKEVQEADATQLVLPWAYTPAKDALSLLGMLEEALHLLIILMTELPLPPPNDKDESLSQAKRRLRREVIHKLVSGAKTHSDLQEIDLVMPLRDTLLLKEEGKLLNPDDASGAALDSALAEVAEKVSRGKTTADQWQVRRQAWDEYDPAFYHISQRNHQTAAENRPVSGRLSGMSTSSPSKRGARLGQPYAPPPMLAHQSFQRIRRDLTADATVMALVYRTLHVHCRTSHIRGEPPCEDKDSEGKGEVVSAYNEAATSETVLARAIHLLTIGVYTWLDNESISSPTKGRWSKLGGSGRGSVFYHSSCSPNGKEWVENILTAKPQDLTDEQWYDGEDSMLVLLRRLADEGGSGPSFFIAQDQAIRLGAAWICQQAANFSQEAASLVEKNDTAQAKIDGGIVTESDLERRKREAKERALRRMQENAAKFAAMMEVADDESEEDGKDIKESQKPSSSLTLRVRTSARDELLRETTKSAIPMELENELTIEHDDVNGRRDCLLQDPPRCIICNDADDGKNLPEVVGEDKVLGFCGYAQASVVMKGGGGIPHSDSLADPIASSSRFVGCHVALCGHAVHSSCCESYVKAASSREDRLTDRLEGKREFRCPLCQRLSNCLVPFVDVGANWADKPTLSYDDAREGLKSTGNNSERGECIGEDIVHLPSLHEFLGSSKWWFSRNDDSVIWDGRCTLVATDDMPVSPTEGEQGRRLSFTPKKLRRSVRSFGKKDLFSAWGAVFKTPRFARKKHLVVRREQGISDKSSDNGTDTQFSATPLGSSDRSMAIEVWRKFMDQISEVSHRADRKRLGDEVLLSNHGEFRHYLVEKSAYNVENRAAGKEIVDWPTCISSTTLSEDRRQELSREKLICKLLLSIQAFTYTCNSEGAEMLRLRRRQLEDGATLDERRSLFSKMGVEGTLCDDELVLLPEPSLTSNGGAQMFDGRIGKLRYFALATMVATSAVSREVTQLALAFPCQAEGLPTTNANDSVSTEEILRAPIVYPILSGHVLTHVVAAMFATCGRGRARSDFNRGSESFYDKSKTKGQSASDFILSDCSSFIRLGFLARTLQVLLGCITTAALSVGINEGSGFVPVMQGDITHYLENTTDLGYWERGCLLLLSSALSGADSSVTGTNNDNMKMPRIELLPPWQQEAFEAAKTSAVAFLSDAGLIMQVLHPAASSWFNLNDNRSFREGKLERLMACLDVESIEESIKSPLVCQVVRSWYKSARSESTWDHPESYAESSTAKISLEKRFVCYTRNQVLDWPLGAPPDTLKEEVNSAADPQLITPASTENGDSEGLQTLPKYSSKKKILLFGGLQQSSDFSSDSSPVRKQIDMLPTSYTDLYADLGTLCPDYVQTAICLVCGTVLNANGKGECTKHATKCGGGAGVFFLLQDCVSLIIHGAKAAYVHSPYVDSHGETPQYRGRPLNLDIDRYESLRDLWTGHLVREKVIAERGSSRQIIIANYY